MNSYAKPGIVLTTLKNYLGAERMQNVMRAYFETWKFKHPKTQDFIAVANETSGQNLNWYFDQALFSNAVLDYSVDGVFTRKLTKNEGFDFGLSVEKNISESGEEDSLTVVKFDSSMAEKQLSNIDSTVGDYTDTVSAEKVADLYLSGINVRRLGEFIFPVELEVIFDNGDTTREVWDGKDLWKKFRYTKPARLISAEIDPDKKIPLDVNYTNNSRTVNGPKIGVNKLAVRFLFWMQFLMDQPEFLNMFTGLGISF